MNRQETLHAAAISIIAEGVAVVLFLAMLFVFVAIYATWPAAAQNYWPDGRHHLLAVPPGALLAVPPTTFPGPAWPAERAPNYDELIREQRRMEMPPSQWREEFQQRVDRAMESMVTQTEKSQRENREIALEYRIRSLEQRLNSPFR